MKVDEVKIDNIYAHHDIPFNYHVIFINIFHFCFLFSEHVLEHNYCSSMFKVIIIKKKKCMKTTQQPYCGLEREQFIARQPSFSNKFPHKNSSFVFVFFFFEKIKKKNSSFFL